MRYAAPLLACLLLAASSALAAPDLSEILVDVVEDAQPVRDVLRRLETQHGLNYVVSEQALADAGTVTVRLKQVPLDEALGAICAACGLSLQIRGTILVMLPQTAGAPAPVLPRAKAGLWKKGARSEPLEPMRHVSPDAPPRSLKRPQAHPPVDQTGKMMVGTVSQVDVKNGRLQLDTGGIKRDLFLPEDADMQSARLQLALGRMKVGFRVALLYRQAGPRAVITDLIGGDKVRDASMPTGAPRSRRRRARRAPRLDPAPRADQPKPKDVPPPSEAKTGSGGPEGVLVGRFLERKGNEVRIRRGDGAIVTCSLPEDDTQRDKVEAVLSTLKKGAKVYMTHEKKDGKIVLTGGLSEIR